MDSTMSENVRLLISFSPFLLIAVIALVFASIERKTSERKRGEWKIVINGTYDYAIYGEYDYVRSRHVGMAGHTTDTYKMKVTAVYFNDGRSVVLKGRHDILFPKGTAIKVSENGLGERKIEKVE